MPLPKVHRVVQDSLGNVVPQVLCSVLLQGTGTLATLWQDDAGTIPLSNPMISDATYGSFGFYVEPGHYDLTFTKPGYTFQPLLDMQVPQDDLTLGTMAQQDANAVAITGGSATFTGLCTCNAGLNTGGLLHSFGTAQFDGACQFVTYTGFGGAPVGGNWQSIFYNKTAESAIQIRQNTSDTGGGRAVQLMNVAGTEIGSIATTAAATLFNTTSDARLKKEIETLAGALDVVRRLRPITHLWRADDSRGYGFVAHEVQDTLPADAGVVTGERDAVDEKGQILPQQMDYGKLVPWLTAALKEAMAQVEALTARVVALERA